MLRAPIIIFATTASLALSAGALAQDAARAQTAPSSTASDQVPEEVRQTRLLNTGVVQRNLEAERQEKADAAAFAAAQSRYEADLAQSEAAQRQHEADLRATAAAAAHAGMEAVAAYWGEEPPHAQGNLRLTRLLGAQTRFTNNADRAQVDAAIAGIANELRAAGRRPYAIPRGGACALGVLGHDRRDGDQRRDERVFDGGGAPFIAGETGENTQQVNLSCRKMLGRMIL